MKKILTLAAIAIIFASSVASASTTSTGMGGKKVFTVTTKAAKSTKAHYSKISVKEFSIKKMQDTKDELLPLTPSTVLDYFTTQAS